MKLNFALRLFVLLCFLDVSSDGQGAQVTIGERTFSIPEGFELELVAGPPLVERPVSMDFDELGRLYVTDSSGSNDKPDKQLKDKPHRVLRLEDSKGNGRFDRMTVFADQMMFPEGCLWHEGSLYVAAPPSIWKLTDTNGDGIVDVRTEWHDGQTLTGCANDLHGPYLGPEGWIYWCKGAFAEQKYEREGAAPFVTRAAHIFRTRPDHSGMEVVLTGGMDNPVGVTFTRTGEPILCGTFFEPNVPGHRDGLIHSIYGGVYGKINDVTDKFKKTGELMPVMTHMGPAAPCSVIRYESQTFGENYRDNLFVCQFNMHKVSRHVLEPDGGTFKTKDIDFMTSENPDFHPTCLLEDADGSLLIVDTGGWYKLCCPTSQLAKPDVLGAIYRVRRTGAKPVNDPRGSKIKFDSMNTTSLAKLLDDPRPWVARKTVAYLGKTRERGAEAIAMALRSGSSVEKQNALWALSRHDSSSAETLFSNAAFHDKDEQVRLTALKCIALGGKFKAGALLERALEDPSPGIRRVAAEALGRLRDSAAVGPLLAAASESQDRALEHSITYALIQIADPKQTANGLMAKNRAAQSAALIALDQMDNGNLEANTVVRFLSSESERMRTTGMWVARHHPTWGDELAGYFHERLTEGKAGEHTDQLVQQLALFAQSKSIQELLAGTLTDSASSPATRQIVLNAMTVAGLKAVPEQWVKAVSSCLETKEKNDELQRATVATVRAFSAVKTNAPNFSDALMAIGRDESRSRLLRLEAMAALPNGLAAVEPATFEFLRASVKTTEPIEVRSAAVTCLTKAKLGKAQLTQLAQDLREAGPLELTRLLSAFEHTSDESIGLALITALTQAKTSSSLRADMVKTLVSKYPERVQEKAGELLKSLNADAASQNARIEQLLGELKNGDVRRGQLVFNSQKTACASCHAIGYLGGHVGPDLTSIGQVRTERDLLESIVYPSASFVRSYEPFIVNTATDETYNGVLKRDAPDEIVLATGPNAEIRIARSAVRDFRPGTVSVMPAGLTEQISKQDLADLLSFLKATKWGAQ